MSKQIAVVAHADPLNAKLAATTLKEIDELIHYRKATGH